MSKPWIVCIMLFKLSRFLIGSDNQRRSGALRWLRCLETGGLQRGNIEDRAQEIGKHVCVYFCTSILKKKKNNNNLFNTWPTPEDLWRTHNQTGNERNAVWEIEPTVNRLTEKLYLHEVNEFKQVQVFLFFFWMCR